MIKLFTKDAVYLGAFGSLVDAQRHLREHYKVSEVNMRHYYALDSDCRWYRLQCNRHGKGIVFVPAKWRHIVPNTDEVLHSLASVRYRQEIWSA